MSIKITCIKKDDGNHENPFIAISAMNWINEENNSTGTTSREEMHDWLNKGGIAYVSDAFGNIAKLVSRISQNGTKYVTTVADKVTSDNLLNLPECNK
ncbi:DUF3892 domain-containing protein [Mucilaginibacter achroorhodeus]|uniref:DUF3892 domain-containing protein n=1 Tax=Mucilaginibacter achroorhodeus TaxID=2599294 RepID=A0A563U625_9SPHI|nr:DUF3892 domain-containing protein [Mucilaginibacter achroorhodeus]TWR26798.1 DUF3892 domain-containing protein [Mucilaginibacter achroorhodeus]